MSKAIAAQLAEALEEAIASIDDYRAGIEFGSPDRKTLGKCKEALAAYRKEPAAAPDAPEAHQAAASTQQEQDRKDADRYRWLRDSRNAEINLLYWVEEEDRRLIDARIDAAMSAEGGTLEKPHD